MHYPEGISPFDWQRLSETAPDELIAILPTDPIPSPEGVFSSRFRDGTWAWTEVDAQSWITAANSPGYNKNVVAVVEELFEYEVLWLLNFTGAISMLVQYMLEVRDENMTDLPQAIVLYRMHVCWPEKRDQIQSEYQKLMSRMDAELKSGYGIPNTL